MIPITKN